MDAKRQLVKAFTRLDKDEHARIRKIIMGNPGLVRELAITEEQQEIIEFIAYRYESTAHEVADHFKCSIQSASSRLSALAKKGYLVRRKSIHNSGGLEYYYMTFQRRDYLDSIKSHTSMRCG